MSAIKISGDTSGAITVTVPDVAGTSVITLPAATDTLVGKNTTDILTSKTITDTIINGFTGDTSAINIGPNQIVKTTSGNVVIGTDTTSTSTTTGALVVSGGVGVAGNLYALTANVNSATVNNNLTVTGTLSFGSLSGGTLSVTNGGTGVTSISSGGIVIGNGTNVIQTVVPGTSGNLLTSNGTNWISSTSLVTGLKNRIINGSMDISQRGTSFVFASQEIGYTLDRWEIYNRSTGSASIAQQADAPSDNEFQNSLRITVTTIYSLWINEYYTLFQRIEGYNVRDLIGKTFTLSFWVRSSKTGIYSVCLLNYGLDRSYVTEYTINAANTWEKKTITVTGGLITAGTWNWATDIGLSVGWTLYKDSGTETSSLNSWQSNDYYASTNQVNFFDTLGNIFAITGVQLELGSVATNFEHRPYGQELALCHRYYYKIGAEAIGNALGSGYNDTTTVAYIHTQFPVPMCSTPDLSTTFTFEVTSTASNYRLYYGSGSTANCSQVPTLVHASNSMARTLFAVASGLTAGQGVIAQASVATAYMAWSAELGG